MAAVKNLRGSRLPVLTPNLKVLLISLIKAILNYDDHNLNGHK